MAEQALGAPIEAARIETMYRNDCRGAWTLVVLLWAVILFVLIMTWPYIPDTRIAVVTAIGAAAILIFNTASIRAMVKHSFPCLGCRISRSDRGEVRRR